jgi:hypothetical protein
MPLKIKRLKKNNLFSEEQVKEAITRVNALDEKKTLLFSMLLLDFKIQDYILSTSPLSNLITCSFNLFFFHFYIVDFYFSY